MADPLSTSSGPSLRWLVPRIFTRAKPNASVRKLIDTVRYNHPRGDLAIIEKAYRIAEEKHRDQKRQSGEPYITHPLAVAQIVAELGLAPRAVAAALLHDTVEDTGYPLDELTEEFGDEVALLVDGVTKLDKVKYGESAQAETVRKMIVAMSKDVRVLVIKLADRLHNARTWGFVPPEKAKKKATETLEIYAPLAHRLGIQAIKSELEDLSFAAMYPKIYNEIDSLVKQRTPQREKYVQKVIDEVGKDLTDLKVRGTVSGRPKQLYSVYQKMVVRGREFDDIYDLIGIRVIVPSVRDCYAVLGSIHARWTPLPGRFKDYIATPKFNLYRSLHTTVIGPGGRTVEIQIRTVEMHQQAEYGVAAHWMYKERMAQTGGKPDPRAADADMAWIARISDWQAETKDPGEFLDSLRYEIGAKEVYVFTPKGRVVGLPKGATPVDFAFAVHTEIGYRTMGAKVNGRLVPLETELASGDVVEVFTSKNPDAGPSQDWLNFVKSTRARNKIRAWFTKERREEAIEQGKESIARAMRRHNLSFARLKEALPEVASQLRYDDISALYAAVGEGHVSSQSVLEKVQSTLSEVDDNTGSVAALQSGPRQRPRTGESGILVRGADDILVKLAKCCTPVPGDEIVGFVTRGSGVSVHRADCTNVKSLREDPERLIDVAWAPTTKAVFLVNIQVEALDRGGLLSDITRVLSEHHVNILSASVQTTRKQLAISRYVFEMGDTVHLDRVLNAVRRIEGVYDVYRVTSS
ncbi:GTP pyrophosphokinase [Microbacterium sorbitolivorans]|uniref:Bifunctional (P)ppGpp synthetase/guanosine-3',5'-bis(Diphosphate) 3'-pyrophosphohydrolase n=1 Tax=Microbacterium sorbitolivorans TaxID=1867410 RepID=A0A367Y798_9MICO|nr:bifunctional (p)ppGpp synthetase/guanosine-3',5'-bis(diphosphate) 3'-pyrophosphohydrolase [Microbacterium sorbitolivorans]RCK61743.1 bifunctional (p)ppGpp synthetase/guanosine-3',5'-bis(diphosphate) 3'-pyrophosphohydrolase [Microbacterium sorbitolivorans]GGF29514.1 GTP pyrophosphokinase [Microbacterium sorbitolivorans]